MPLAIAFAVALPAFPFADRRLMDIAILVMTYVMLGWGLNIVVGLAGLLDLGYVAFYAVGAYGFALLATGLHLGFWECLPLAGALAASFGIALGFPVLRLRGDYLAIVTLGFGEMIRIVLTNWVSLTNGPNGISGIPRPDFFGVTFSPVARGGGTTFHQLFDVPYSPMQRIVFLYYLILAMALVTNLVTLRLRRLPIGRAWEALREDEIACRALGINPTAVKLSAFAMGAMFGGFAGAFFATRQGFISPESFTFIESAIILAIVVLGGMGSQTGVALAAFVLIGVPEWFRALQEYRMLAFGVSMVLIMTWRPRGLLARREPDHPARRAQGGAVTRAAHGRGADHAVRRARRRRRVVFRGRGGGDHRPDRAERRRQDDGVQLRHRLLPAERGDADPGERRAPLPAGAHGRPPHRAPGARRADLPERAAVRRHVAAGEFAGGPAQRADARLGLHGRRAARPRRLQARPSGAAVEVARGWLDRIGLTDRADDLAGNLSYGDQRRLEIARAMCTGPALLCLDEPAAGLNPRESAALTALLAEIRGEAGTGILLIEHDMSVVMGISDRIVVLDYGRKIADGAPEAVRRDARVIAAYLGEDEP